MTGLGRSTGASRPRRRSWVLAFKVGATVAIFAFLFWRIDLAASIGAVRQALWFWLLAGLLSNVLLLIVSTYKWRALLAALGISMPAFRLFEIYTIGFFASSFLPGIVGGDLVRWHMTGSQTGQHVKVAATILAERVTGVVTLILCCPLLVLVATPELAVPAVLVLVAGMGLALLGLLALALNRRLATSITYRFRGTRLRPLLRAIYKLHQTLRTFPRRPLAIALLYSAAFYVSGGLTFYLICRAFGAEVGLVEIISAQALVSLLTLIPISLGGLGLMQAGDVFLLGILGVSAPHALAISIVRQLVNYAYAGLGGLLFIRGGELAPRPAQPDSGKPEQEIAASETGAGIKPIGQQ